MGVGGTIFTNRKIVCVDVSDLLIIDTVDALLISKKGSSQRVKEVVNILEKDNSTLLDEPTTVKKPWGSYTVLQDLPSYKVKQLEITPGKRISLQYHHKREEHLVVVQGLAKIEIDGIIKTYSRNETAFIPTKARHRIENIGQLPLIIIETQIGSYFGEDDIIRIEDDWNR
ncbi:phosphomannose isomerase type II C-terminal cupin domain [Thiospirochaeta perfilievii]|uniref:phosphomannose isomerase type II C-terminal cupin domain n=1 Tax=Thiospirochaeta perfilievii TaxID=252967 RepID=UPI0024824787|nr:cupin domain-containing protein [Thiospirochaeta perfilievii]